MQSLRHLILASAIFTLIFAAPADISSCPEHCDCTSLEDTWSLKCTSIDAVQPDFINKVTKLDFRHPDPAQIQTLKDWVNLKELDLSNNGLTTVNIPPIPHLVHLKLNRNNIKDITATSIPKTVEILDLSFNAFSSIPQELLDLHLEKLNIYGNPIVCKCEEPSYVTYRKLVADGVVFVKPVECATPVELKGQHLSSLKCKHVSQHLEHLQGDKTLPGIWSNEVVDDEQQADDEGIEQGFLLAQSQPEPTSQVLEEQEGSGDGEETHHEQNVNENDATTATTKEPFADDEYEGSGAIEDETPEDTNLFIQPVCHFNCTTEEPVVASNENDSQSPPSILDILTIIKEDIGGKPTTTTTTEAPVDEMIQKTKVAVQNAPVEPLDKEMDVDSTGSDKVVELDRASVSPSDQANTAYIVVAALIVLIVGLVLYVMIKRKKDRARARENGLDPEKPKPVEMKELLKKPVSEVQQPAEKAPLLNGQNGKSNGKTDSEYQTKPQPTETAPVNDEIELRPRNEDLLTPEMKRVTVQAKELTVPKTPILVNRSLSSEGKMVSTNADSP